MPVKPSDGSSSGGLKQLPAKNTSSHVDDGNKLASNADTKLSRDSNYNETQVSISSASTSSSRASSKHNHSSSRQSRRSKQHSARKQSSSLTISSSSLASTSTSQETSSEATTKITEGNPGLQENKSSSSSHCYNRKQAKYNEPQKYKAKPNSKHKSNVKKGDICRSMSPKESSDENQMSKHKLTAQQQSSDASLTLSSSESSSRQTASKNTSTTENMLDETARTNPSSKAEKLQNLDDNIVLEPTSYKNQDFVDQYQQSDSHQPQSSVENKVSILDTNTAQQQQPQTDIPHQFHQQKLYLNHEQTVVFEKQSNNNFQSRSNEKSHEQKIRKQLPAFLNPEFVSVPMQMNYPLDPSIDMNVPCENTCTLKKGVLWQQRNYDKFHKRLFSRWKKRFFVLTTDYLVCFKHTIPKVGRSEMGQFIYKVSIRQ